MPAHSVSTPIHHENVHILPQTPQLIALLTYARSLPPARRAPALTGPAAA